MLGRSALLATTNFAVVSDADANAYILAVEAKDGQQLEDGVRNAINDFVIGCKADGIWSAIKASCILAGARTLTGALVPLVGSAPTNFNFVSADYNRKTGLLGNATNKYINSNRSNNADPQNSRHIAVYASTRHTIDALYISTTTYNTSGDSYLFQGNPNNNLTVTAKLSSGGTPVNIGGTFFVNGFFGAARSSFSSISIRKQGETLSQSVLSVAPLNQNLMVFGVPGFYSNAVIAFYSMGESLALDKLDSRLSTLITAISAAIP